MTFEHFSHKKSGSQDEYFYGGKKDMNTFLYGDYMMNITLRDRQLIAGYLQSANNISINDIIGSTTSRCTWTRPETNFNLYVVAFTSWADVAHSGVTVDVTTVARGKLKCPPEITKELYKFENTTLI
jgi:hypothetical protein